MLRVTHLASVGEVLDALKADVPNNPFLREGSEDEYEWASDGELCRLIPTLSAPFSSPFIYRGQTSRFQPCVPGVFRGLPLLDHPQRLPRSDLARCFMHRVRLEEFLDALEGHPATAFAKEIGLARFPMALAQHYEMVTDRLDLTQNPDIAAFFATNYPGGDGGWVEEHGGVGVIYRLRVRDFWRSQSPDSPLEWIGRQALPRPGEQKAYTLQLPFGCDFESLPVEAFTFEQDQSWGRKLRSQFHEGRKLFPLDVMSEVAEGIRSARSMPLALVRRQLIRQGLSHEALERELEASAAYYSNEFGVSIEDRPTSVLSKNQLAKAEAGMCELTKGFVGYARPVSQASEEEMKAKGWV